MSAEFETKFRETILGAKCDSILELGCRFGGMLMKVPEARIRVGIDAHLPYLQYANERDGGKACKDLLLMNADMRMIGSLFIPKSFDAVISIDSIEHLYKDDAKWALAAAEKIARKVVIVWTPNGFMKAPPPDDAVNFNVEFWMEHRCGFTDAEMKTYGYDVTLFTPDEIDHAKGKWQSIFCVKKL